MVSFLNSLFHTLPSNLTFAISVPTSELSPKAVDVGGRGRDCECEV